MNRQVTTIVLEFLRLQITHMSMGCCCERFFAHPLALLDTAALRVTALGSINGGCPICQATRRSQCSEHSCVGIEELLAMTSSSSSRLYLFRCWRGLLSD